MSTRAIWSLVVALVLLQPLAAEGQKVKPADRGPWEISAFMGSFDDDYEFDPDGRTLYVDPDNNVIFGGFLFLNDEGANFRFPHLTLVFQILLKRWNGADSLPERTFCGVQI